MWNAYHTHYLKWLKIYISDIIIQVGNKEEMEWTQTGTKFKGNYTALHHMNNQYLMAIWDKYDVIKDDNHPIFEDWRRFYPGIRKRKPLFMCQYTVKASSKMGLDICNTSISILHSFLTRIWQSWYW